MVPSAESAADLILKVEDLARGGAGVARDPEGRVVFIPFTAPGDLVRVRLVQIKKRYAQAELVEILEPSPLRVTPRCQVFGKCGGCEWQHLPYSVQWKTKVRGVRHALDRLGVRWDDPGVNWAEFPSDADEEGPWNYRNRVQLRGFKEQLGFYAPRTHRIVSIERCEIARPEINQELVRIREEGRERTRPYKVEVGIDEHGTLQKAWNARHASFGFRQVNDRQNQKLQEWVAGSITRDRHLLDLFGGNGNLSLPVAAEMRAVDCVDTSAPTRQPIGVPDRVRFHRSAVLPWLFRAVQSDKWTPQGPVSVIVDPPRTGLGRDLTEVAESLETLQACELVAVGCDPDAWASDVFHLMKRKWRLAGIAVFDFFPQTHHVESAACLIRL